MTGNTRLVLLTLACGFLCQSCAVDIQCFVSRCAEGYRYVPRIDVVGCDFSYQAESNTGKKTVMATHKGHGDGVVKSSVHDMVTDKCITKILYEANCDSTSEEGGFDHYNSTCETTCSEEVTAKPNGTDPFQEKMEDSANHANIVAPVVVSVVILLVAAALIYKFRNHIRKKFGSTNVL